MATQAGDNVIQPASAPGGGINGCANTNMQNARPFINVAEERQSNNNQMNSGTSPGTFFGIILGILVLLLVLNIDSLLDVFGSSAGSNYSSSASQDPYISPTPTTTSTNTHAFSSTAPSGTRLDKLPHFGLEFIGNYILKGGLSNGNHPTTASRIAFSQHDGVPNGTLHISLFTRRTIVNNLRTAHITLQILAPSGHKIPDKKITLSGFDLRDARKFIFRGIIDANSLYNLFNFDDLGESPFFTNISGISRSTLDDRNHYEDAIGNGTSRSHFNSMIGRQCSFTGAVVLHFDISRGKSIREVDEPLLQQFVSDMESDQHDSYLGQKESMKSPIGRNLKEFLQEADLLILEPFLMKSESYNDDLPLKKISLRRNLRNSGRSHSSPLLLELSLPSNDEASSVPDSDIFPLIVGNESTLNVPNGDNGAEIIDPNVANFDMQGRFISADCNIGLYIYGWEVDISAIVSHVVHISFFFNLKSLLEMRSFWLQIQHTELSTTAAKVSIVTLVMHSAIDVFEAISMLYIGFLSKYMLSYFAIVAFLKFVLFCMMEVRYLIIVWKTRNQENINQHWELVRSEINRLYRNFYGCLILVVLSVYYVFPFFPYYIFIFYFFWVPQILCDIWRGQRNSLNPYFILGISLCRLVFPLYIFGCSQSIFSNPIVSNIYVQRNIPFCIAICTVVTIQVVLLFIQRKFGSRSFVPLDFLPHVYNYHRSQKDLSFDEEYGIPECVICMNEIRVKDSRSRALTPCDHYFHSKCLQQWMNIKMECPTCRRQLPPFP